MRKLKLELNAKGLIKNKESDFLEFKRSFHKPSSDQFTQTSRTMAGFANCSGGYIVFGIDDRPHTPIGLNSKWSEFDPKDITNFLQNHFSPEIKFESSDYTINIDGKEILFGVIKVLESSYKPVICKARDNKGVLKLNAVYKRYGARTDEIKPDDFIILLNQEREKERKKWLELFEKIGKIGFENVGILNLSDGEISGHNGNFYIDESLLPKIKFINEGNFVEKAGAPTLKLIGNLETVALTIEKAVHVPVAHPNLLKPGVVVKQIQEYFKKSNIEKKFNLDTHTRCCRKYKVRPKGKSKNPESTLSQYCIYDALNGNYGYTDAWVEFLKIELTDEKVFATLYEKNVELINGVSNSNEEQQKIDQLDYGLTEEEIRVVEGV